MAHFRFVRRRFGPFCSLAIATSMFPPESAPSMEVSVLDRDSPPPAGPMQDARERICAPPPEIGWLSRSPAHTRDGPAVVDAAAWSADGGRKPMRAMAKPIFCG